MWLGVHFRFADVASRDMGLRLSGWTLDHYFQPVRHEDSDQRAGRANSPGG